MHRAGTWIKRLYLRWWAPSRTELYIHGGSTILRTPHGTHMTPAAVEGVYPGVYGVYAGVYAGIYRGKLPFAPF